ncbi:MAG: hypothetical protein Q9162_006998 [Coniocarpon cinnabarinum]
MAAEQSEKFKQAVEDSRKLKQKPGQNEMLDLYGLFKQGTQDPPIEKASKPGMFDMVGKEKRKAWERVVEKGTKPEQAQVEYVQYVEDLKDRYGFDGAATEAPAEEKPAS